jgi:ADP-ribose pyrophosphatase
MSEPAADPPVPGFRVPEGDPLLQARRFDVRRIPWPGVPGGQGDIIVHPGAVVILPLLEERRVVFVRNLRRAIGRELLELPAGTLDPGEEPAAAAARELCEETGYRAGRLEHLGSFFTAPGFLTELLHAYVATELTLVGQDLDEGEELEVEVLSREEVEVLVASGSLHDAKTLAALFLEQARGR